MPESSHRVEPPSTDPNPGYRPPGLTTLLGLLLSESVRELQYEPLRDELFERCIRRGQTTRARLRFWMGLFECFSMALVSSLLDQTTRFWQRHSVSRFAGFPVTGLAAGSLALVVAVKECAWTGLALVLLNLLS